MKQRLRHNGFSLTEVLLATGVLAIGLVMIAMVFPVGVKLTSTATERTVAATAASEAFAKIQLFGRDPDGPAGPLSAVIKPASVPGTISANLNFMYPSLLPGDERWYPSEAGALERKYHWSAMVRKISDTTLQTTVFVSRLLSQNASYYDPNHPQGLAVGKWPEPFPVEVKLIGVRTLEITSTTPGNMFTEGSIILVSNSGALYRVVEIKDVNNNGIRDLILDRDYNDTGSSIRVIPPASGSTRNPCIGVYQRLLEF